MLAHVAYVAPKEKVTVPSLELLHHIISLLPLKLERRDIRLQFIF